MHVLTVSWFLVGQIAGFGPIFERMHSAAECAATVEALQAKGANAEALECMRVVSIDVGELK